MLVAIEGLPTKRVASSGRPAPDGDIATTESTRIPQMQDRHGLEPREGRAFQRPCGPPERAGFTLALNQRIGGSSPPRPTNVFRRRCARVLTRGARRG